MFLEILAYVPIALILIPVVSWIRNGGYASVEVNWICFECLEQRKRSTYINNNRDCFSCRAPEINKGEVKMFRGTGYYWIDRAGKLHRKPTAIVEAIGTKEYFASPNCVKWWRVRSIEDYNKILEVLGKVKTT